jgi:SAM-dependent methyltransferase
LDRSAGGQHRVIAPTLAKHQSDAATALRDRRCRFCSAVLRHTFVDLGMSPLCESFVPAERLNEVEPFYPLHVYVCEECFLVQLDEYVSPEEIFTEYAYFSSFSDSWVEHMRRYAAMAVSRFGLQRRSLVVEVASNDGYLLQFFRARGVRVLGVEPAGNVAAAAEERGIPTVVGFFGRTLAERLLEGGYAADLVVGNNVLAHVPDAHDFVEGLHRLLKPDGILTMEFPHLLRLVQERQFDTIYHEHFSYFSLQTAERLFAAHDLVVFDVEELPTHGGSLRIYVAHTDAHPRLDERVTEVREKERSIVAYGAAAKGVTLLNFCGIGSDFIDYVVDRSPHKQGRFLPGVRLPIYPPEETRRTRPDLLLILPWNLVDEIAEQMAFVRDWGCELVVPIPEVAVIG